MSAKLANIKLETSNEFSGDANYLIHGDNLDALNQLSSLFNGKIDLIYIDPPFATQNTFRSSENRSATISSSLDAVVAYSDVYTLDEYLDFLKARVAVARGLLSDTGSFYIHTDVKVGHYVKLMMDDVFGRENFRNEITRIKCNPKNFRRRSYGNIKDTILFYTKLGRYIWNDPKVLQSRQTILRRYNKIDELGRRYTTTPLHAPGETINGATGGMWRGMHPPEGRHWIYPPEELEKLDREGLIEWSSTGNPRKIMYAEDAISDGVRMQDVWEFKDPQNPDYPTQKNLDLLETIVTASSNSQSTVLDFFCGSGTTLQAANNLGRRWIGVDSSEAAINVANWRLMETEHQCIAI